MVYLVTNKRQNYTSLKYSNFLVYFHTVFSTQGWRFPREMEGIYPLIIWLHPAPIIWTNGNGKDLHCQKFIKFAEFLGENRCLREKNIDTTLLHVKVEKGYRWVNIANYILKVQRRLAPLSICNCTSTIMQLYADEYATVRKKSAYSVRNCTRFWCERGLRRQRNNRKTLKWTTPSGCGFKHSGTVAFTWQEDKDGTTKQNNNLQYIGIIFITVNHTIACSDNSELYLNKFKVASNRVRASFTIWTRSSRIK